MQTTTTNAAEVKAILQQGAYVLPGEMPDRDQETFHLTGGDLITLLTEDGNLPVWWRGERPRAATLARLIIAAVKTDSHIIAARADDLAAEMAAGVQVRYAKIMTGSSVEVA